MGNSQVYGNINQERSKYCPNELFSEDNISLGEFKTINDAMEFPIHEVWCVNRSGGGNEFQKYKDSGVRILIICDWGRNVQDVKKFVVALVFRNGEVIYYDMNDVPIAPDSEKYQYEGSLGHGIMYTIYQIVEHNKGKYV